MADEDVDENGRARWVEQQEAADRPLPESDDVDLEAWDPAQVD